MVPEPCAGVSNYGRHRVVRAALACAMVLLYFTTLIRRMNHALESDPTAILADRSRSSSRQPQAQAKTKTTNAPFSFSACLLIKDDSIILPEWLAYHYTVLPLRRLIVAIDPMSHTDPQRIFDSYRSIGMNVTIWKNDTEEYWRDGVYAHEKRGFNFTADTDHRTKLSRHRHRQKSFYAACLRRLKEEGRTWTVAVDTDEYVAFNYYDEGREGAPSGCRGNSTCVADYERAMRDGTHHRARLPESDTAAEHMSKGFDGMFDNNTADVGRKKPCIIVGRYLFPSTIDSSGAGHESLLAVPPRFNSTYFHTLRYQHRVGLGEQAHGKCIIDASRYDGRGVGNPHRMLGDLCTGYNSYAHNSDMSFRVHHYVGSLESFRRPGFDSRGLEKFRQRNTQKHVEADNSLAMRRSLWLADFASQVGSRRAFELTQQLRIDAELEMKNLIG